MIVVDVNVLAYLHVDGEHTQHAERVLQHDPEFAAPRLWRSEFRSVLIRYGRSGTLSWKEIQFLMDHATGLLRGREYEVASDRVFEVLQRSRLSAYDAEYVALAEELGVPLVTADREILRAFPTSTVSMADFAGGD